MENTGYKNRSREFGAVLTSFLANQESILLTTWKSDDDGISSVLALHFILSRQFPDKQIRVVVPHFPNPRFSTFPSYKDIKFTTSIVQYLPVFRCVIFIDGSIYRDFKLTQEEIDKYNVNTVIIDHHATPSDRATLTFIEPHATSCAELLYHMYYSGKEYTDSYLAELFPTGIFGDTGSLKYIDRNRTSVYAVTQELIQTHNLNIGQIITEQKLFSNNILPLIQLFLKNTRIESIPGWPECTVSYVKKSELTRNKYDVADIEETANFVISAIGTIFRSTSWACTLFPIGNRVKAKFRSRSKTVNVRMIAEGTTLGGRHDQASGGFFREGDPEYPRESFEFVRQWLSSRIFDDITGTFRARQDIQKTYINYE